MWIHLSAIQAILAELGKDNMRYAMKIHELESEIRLLKEESESGQTYCAEHKKEN